jgi:E3 ubiquitin-protein ligase HECTD1
VDDVGQTLLNWCSAFGTTDMVIYLCDKGADPNKGQRSSSLHYAACFGRTEIVKILLRYGASPNLQDVRNSFIIYKLFDVITLFKEEGRTALDKARERNNEAHQQVCDVLQNPGAYMSSISSAMAQLQQQRAGQTQESKTEKEKIDHALAEAFIQQLLPVFCTIFNVNNNT